MDQTFGCWFSFPLNVGAFPTVTASGEIATEKWPAHKCFQAVCDSQPHRCWKSSVPSKKVRHHQRVWFQAISVRTVLILRCETSVLSQGPEIQRQSVCFLPFLQLENIPVLCRECPWGNRLCNCVWECWLPYCAYPEAVMFIWKWSRPQAGSLLLARNLKRLELTLALRSKKRALGWSFKLFLAAPFRSVQWKCEFCHHWPVFNFTLSICPH